MPRYKVRDADTYRHSIGILLLDYRDPFIPGDVGNASTYKYPELYKLVEGLTFNLVLSGDPKSRSHDSGSSQGSGALRCARHFQRLRFPDGASAGCSTQCEGSGVFLKSFADSLSIHDV